MAGSAYCSTKDVKSAIREIGESQMSIEDTTIQQRIEEASAIVDGYLYRVYEIPFKQAGVACTTPPLVVMITKYLACSFCIEWVMSIKNEVSSQSKTTAQLLFDRYTGMLESMISAKAAMPILKADFRSGVMPNKDGGFTYTIEEPTSAYPGIFSTTTGYKPTFTEESPERWTIDRRKLRDLRIMGSYAAI